MRTTEAPTLVVLAIAGAGLALAALVDFEPGMVLLAVALLLAAALRLTLPVRQAGWLVVRSRGLDSAVLLALGAGVLLLAATVPRP